MRPDRTTKTYWRTAVEQHVLEDPDLEVLLPEAATLSDVDHTLLVYGSLPELWAVKEITVENVHELLFG